MRGVGAQLIEAEAVLVIKRETCLLGGTWGGGGERKYC